MWGLGCRSGELAAGGVVRWASKGRGRTGADTKVQSLSSWSSRERGGRAVRARGRCAVCVCVCGCGCVRGVSGCGSLRDAQERRQRPRDGAGGSGGPPLWRPLEGRGEAPGSAPGRAGTRRRASVFLVSPSGQIQCHVCEEYNNFNCFNPVNCDAGDIYCVTAAVRECRAGPRTARGRVSGCAARLRAVRAAGLRAGQSRVGRRRKRPWPCRARFTRPSLCASASPARDPRALHLRQPAVHEVLSGHPCRRGGEQAVRAREAHALPVRHVLPEEPLQHPLAVHQRHGAGLQGSRPGARRPRRAGAAPVTRRCVAGPQTLLSGGAGPGPAVWRRADVDTRRPRREAVALKVFCAARLVVSLGRGLDIGGGSKARGCGRSAHSDQVPALLPAVLSTRVSEAKPRDCSLLTATLPATLPAAPCRPLELQDPGCWGAEHHPCRVVFRGSRPRGPQGEWRRQSECSEQGSSVRAVGRPRGHCRGEGDPRLISLCLPPESRGQREGIPLSA